VLGVSQWAANVAATVTGFTKLKLSAAFALSAVACIVAAAVGVPGSSASTAAGAGRAYLAIGNTLAGPLAVNNRGYVLFTFTENRRGQDRCLTISGCVMDWPPLTTIGKPIAGPGINPALLGSIPYRGNLRQVTYAGHALDTYRFAASADSSVTNIGIKQFGGPWDAVSATGRTVG
jgi:predicted lipoprotein with Yx(FWY)xxD motif